MPERERLNQRYVEALIRLTGVLESAREYRRALSYAQRLRQIDPLREETYVTLMRLHALGQDRAGALRVYHQCVTLLQAELGVEPGEQVRAAYEQLREPGAHAPAGAPRQSARAPLIGRHTEWQRLRAAWQRASGGQALFALITGEAGIGKTRLADELLDWAGQQGATVARTRAYAAEGRLPYGAIAEWLRGGALFGALSRLDDIWLGEIARLLPELLIEHPHLAPPGPLTERWQRQRFFQALARGVIAGGAPLALQFDDLQWCDQETLEWLHFLLRFEPSARLLLVGTLRVEERRDNPALVALLQALRRTDQLIEISLAPLDAAETSRMAAIISGRAVEVGEALRLFGETEGNPLFISEMAQARLSRAAATGAYAADALQLADPSMPLPPVVYAVIAGRLAQLSPDAGRLLGVAATIGRSFTVEVLAQASGHAADALVAALDELWQRRIIREQGVNVYDFSHDKLRDVAYRELSPIQRRTLHQRVASALEMVHAEDLDPLSAQLATHYEQAGRAQSALGYYERAALVAQRVFAHAEAIQLLRKGLALLPAIATGRERDLRELAMQTELGASLVALEGYGAAGVMAAYQRARSLCEQLGQPPSPPILRGLALTHIVRAESQQAHQLGGQLLDLAKRERDTVLLVEAQYVLGVALFWQGAFMRSRMHLEQALAHYDPQHTHTHLALYTQDPRVVCLIRLAENLWALGYPDQAHRTGQEALALARALAHPFSLVYAAYYDTQRHVVARSLHEVLAGAEATIELCREYQVHYWWGFAIILRGWAKALRGATEIGMAQIHEGMAILAADDTRVAQPLQLALLAELYAQAGDVERGLEFKAEALAAADAHGERWYAAEIYRVRGELLLLRGDATAAEGAFQRALAVARSQEARSLDLRAATSLARLWQRHGRAQDARQLLSPIYGWFSEGFDTPDLIAAAALLDELS